VPFNQDDQRERAMVGALNLRTRPDRARHEEDAYLDVEVDGQLHRLLFECKSAPEEGDFGTGRDTGLRKLIQWAGYHFVFGWFLARDNIPIRMWYGSPRLMRGWVEYEKEYLQADLALLDIVPSKVDDEVVTALFGDKEVLSYEEMNKVMKAQWDAVGSKPDLYTVNADVRRGRRRADHLYSREAALKALRDRTAYLLKRGGTVNNRKIAHGYVLKNCIELNDAAWARSLERAVASEVEKEPPNNLVSSLSPGRDEISAMSDGGRWPRFGLLPQRPIHAPIPEQHSTRVNSVRHLSGGLVSRCDQVSAATSRCCCGAQGRGRGIDARSSHRPSRPSEPG
jgi:hypothetical protein